LDNESTNDKGEINGNRNRDKIYKENDYRGWAYSISTNGGHNNIMTHKTKKKETRKAKRERKGQSRGGLNTKDRLELANARSGAGQEASINAKGELQSTTPEERKAGGIKKTVNREEEREGRIVNKQREGEGQREIIKQQQEEESGQGGVAGALDLISAPLSQPGATLSGGFEAGAAAVRESRAKIAGGDSAEQAKVALTTILTTATLAAPFTVGISKAAIAAAVAASSTSGMMTWLASDNVLGTASIFTRDLAQGVKFGGDPIDAANAIAETTAVIDETVSFINFQTMINPVLWPFSKVINENAKQTKRVFEFNRDFILQEAERGNQDGRQ